MGKDSGEESGIGSFGIHWEGHADEVCPFLLPTRLSLGNAENRDNCCRQAITLKTPS
jgi:hypothetical protein